jgi:phage terminase large subunit
MDGEERKPWDRIEGEPHLWFSRFTSYRLLGPSRNLAEVKRRERQAKGRPVRGLVTVPGAWRDAARTWDWKPRAEAWDQHIRDQAEAEWKAQIMGGSELLARLSQMARANVNDFVDLDQHGYIAALSDTELKERGHLVKKISTSRGRTDKLSIEMYDAQIAMRMLGDWMRLFNADDPKDTGEVSNFALPADVIAPSFYNVYRDIRDHLHTEYVFYGGRGSTKSTFVSLVIIYLLLNNPNFHAIALRQVSNTLRDSVYSQFLWAISELGLDDKFRCVTSPLEIEYRPTGQKIYFRGADDPGKIKSIKPPFGYIGVAWFEELDQFHGPEAIRNIEQSAIRGGDLAYIFKSFNPPRTLASWANKYVKIPKVTQYQHSSTYLDVPPEWLGKPWIEEAEHLKTVNPKAYEHEYLGVANGTGGLVFENVQLRAISDDEIAQFDRVTQGTDWGFFPDPWTWNKVHYDTARMTLYIFDEAREFKKSNLETFKILVYDKHVGPEDLLIVDSAEPKSVGDYRQYSADGLPALDENGKQILDSRRQPVMLYGPTVRGAEKGPESVKYSMKWLQSLAAIVIDPQRCPETATEFLEYELEQDPDGNYISEYPDKNNHHIDDVRYATNLIWKRRGQ